LLETCINCALASFASAQIEVGGLTWPNGGSDMCSCSLSCLLSSGQHGGHADRYAEPRSRGILRVGKGALRASATWAHLPGTFLWMLGVPVGLIIAGWFAGAVARCMGHTFCDRCRPALRRDLDATACYRPWGCYCVLRVTKVSVTSSVLQGPLVCTLQRRSAAARQHGWWVPH
jgi:hypothetical protein